MMKFAIAALIAAASITGAAAPVAAQPRHEVRRDYHRHHVRHRVCEYHHHHRVCSYR